MNAAKRKQFDEDVQRKIKEVNDQNLKNLRLEQAGDQVGSLQLRVMIG